MRDIEKQILYNKFLHNDIELEDIPSGDLKSLKVLWLNHKMKTQPTVRDWDKFDNELRRREQEAASKPMKEIDRGFFK